MSNRKDLANGVIAKNATNTTTTLYLEVGYGQTMPTVPFYLTLTPPGQLSTRGNSEIVKVTARVDDMLTVERAQKDTTAKTITAGWVAANAIYLEDTRLYSVGDIFITTRSGNPSTLLGYGTWTMFAPGRALVGLSDTGTFNEMGKEIGSETHKLTQNELPLIQGTIAHQAYGEAATTGVFSQQGGYTETYESTRSGNLSTVRRKLQFGQDIPHNNIQPSKTVAMWLRTA